MREKREILEKRLFDRFLSVEVDLDYGELQNSGNCI